ncbi:hypothetical protein D3C81_1632680 [compost metagenome]
MGQRITHINILRNSKPEKQGQKPAVPAFDIGEQTEYQGRIHIPFMHLGPEHKHDSNQHHTDKKGFGKLFAITLEGVICRRSHCNQDENKPPGSIRDAEPHQINRGPHRVGQRVKIKGINCRIGIGR